MTKREALLTCCLTAMSLCACGVSVPDTNAPHSVEVEGSGVVNGEQTKTLTCTNTVVTLDRDLSGNGAPSIKVTDGANNVIFDHERTPITGNENESEQLSGSNGTWTLDVDPNGFSGSLKVTLHCP